MVSVGGRRWFWEYSSGDMNFTIHQFCVLFIATFCPLFSIKFAYLLFYQLYISYSRFSCVCRSDWSLFINHDSCPSPAIVWMG